MNKIRLIDEQANLYDYTPVRNQAEPEKRNDPPIFNREVFAAAHVCVDPRVEAGNGLNPAIDWETTLEFREYLWDLGFGVAESMDTAQRGMGLDVEKSMELVRKSCALAKLKSGRKIACGASTDYLEAGKTYDLETIEKAYLRQFEEIEIAGGDIILMAGRHLCKSAKSAEDYLSVYGKILSQSSGKVIIHWLGDMFDPLLKGYWGSEKFEIALQTCLQMIKENRDKIAGIKLSLLDKSKELQMRKLLPQGVKMFTGDDYNYPDLIAGDEDSYSDALLGIFDPIAPIASKALKKLTKGDREGFFQQMNPTVSLARLIFKPPTQFYKTGVVFLAYLNGFQSHFLMVGNQQSARSPAHFCEIYKEADKIGLLRDPERAEKRLSNLLKIYGIE